MASCKACDEPLVLHVAASEDDGEDAGTIDIPDDVRLPCRCHYHWQCLMDSASSVISSFQCPSCGKNISSSAASATSSSRANDSHAILVRYINEGGMQDCLDISPSMREEAYLEAHPEAAPARAFHVMCAEGDLDGLVELLYHSRGQVPDIGSLIRYRDPLSEMKSGLHLAVENRQEGVAWLLLWLSSSLPSDVFPLEARQSVESVGLGRLEVGSHTDIRGLLDSKGRTAAVLSAQLGSPHLRLADSGLRLDPRVEARVGKTTVALSSGKSGLRPGLLIRQLVPHSAPSSPRRRIMSTQDEGAPNGKPKSEESQETPYWSSALSSIGIWNSAKPSATQFGKEAAEEANALKSKTLTDHLTTAFYGQSSRSYPKDCPLLEVQWFHAVDVPKRTTLPAFNAKGASETKPLVKPKKFSAFSTADSRRIEVQYQSLIEADEERRSMKGSEASSQCSASDPTSKDTCVPVNEDFLFDVSIKRRELCPVYWLGPVYEVRRGTWFFQDGSSLRPCEENLAAQLEEGYLKMRAWVEPEKRVEFKQDSVCSTATGNGVPVAVAVAGSSGPEAEAKQVKLKSHRLFGTYMNNTVTYEDSSTAWLVSDGVLSWVATSIYERFAGGGHMSGVKLIRGYSDQNKAKEKERSDKKQSPTDIDNQKAAAHIPRSADAAATSQTNTAAEALTGKAMLQRRLSTIIESEDRRIATSDNDVQKLNEEEMRHDYSTQSGELQNREIEHLVLVTHGIGQRLSLRTQSVNFIHDVNVLRKTLKGVYTNSPELRSMNIDEGNGPGNCRMQVLPVCWRHKLDFPRGRKRKTQTDETDVAEAHDEEEKYPTLEEITIDGASFARTLISDLALDVLLYQSSYRGEIAQTVIEESNRIVNLFRQRNPNFKGKIHLVGHSLGSAILFDILCHENRQRRRDSKPNPLRFLPHRGSTRFETNDTLDFDVEDFYCLGSPIGLFQMLKGRTIAARQSERNVSKVGLARAVDSESMNDGFIADFSSDCAISRPDAQQLYNIFYPSDPISYRLEPLVASCMASLKPHNLPYTKKGIFGAVGSQGLTGIGTKVSGLFASLSTGLSTNLLPASLRITSEEAQVMMREDKSPETSAGTTSKETKKKGNDTVSGSQGKEDEGALANHSSQISTLYSRFQMSDERSEEVPKDADADGTDHKTQKQRMAQRKVWALNQNGRVDFSIQEGALDFNPISTIASHIGYWGEEDVSHFMLSQVLSRAEKRASEKPD
ncbi:hypothetical protein MY11210_007056 [Beauveria gryllotalpidicola]